jgi:hypothetical protein
MSLFYDRLGPGFTVENAQASRILIPESWRLKSQISYEEKIREHAKRWIIDTASGSGDVF